MSSSLRAEFTLALTLWLTKEIVMHYRNGRTAACGDKIVKLSFEGAKIVAFGVLFDAVPGNDYCNGSIAPVTNDMGACMCDCLHIDDLAALLKEKGWDKRPANLQ